MIHHKVLKRYLQPGGHIDASDKSPLEAAKRELFEEIGIDTNLLDYKAFCSFNEVIPFNLSVYMIPENSEKKEDYHYHYNLKYLFLCEKELDFIIDLTEINSYEWISWDIFKEMSEYEGIFRKIERI